MCRNRMRCFFCSNYANAYSVVVFGRTRKIRSAKAFGTLVLENNVY